MINSTKIEKKSVLLIFLSLIISIITIIISFLTQENFIILIFESISIILLGMYLIKRDFILIMLTIMSSFLVEFFVSNLQVNSNLYRIIDYFILIILLKLLYYTINNKIKFRQIYVYIIVFIFITVISFIYNNINFIVYIRYLYSDYIRYFIIFLGVINFRFNNKSINKLIKIFWGLLLIQFPIVIFQHFYTLKNWIPIKSGDIRQDYVAGLMGGRGTAELGMMICFAVTTLFVLYQKKQYKIGKLMLVLIMFSIILILGEIKFAFMLMVMMIMIVCLTSFKVRNTVIILLISASIVIGINGIKYLYPQFQNLLNKEKFQNYITMNYANSGLNRVTSIITTDQELSYNILNRLFGYGISTARLENIEGDKLTEYQKKSKYNFSIFTVSHYLIENGWTGFVLLSLVLIKTLIMSIKLKVYSINNTNKIIGSVGIPFIFSIFFNIFYSMSMEKLNFAMFAWALIGLIHRKYYEENIEVLIE